MICYRQFSSYIYFRFNFWSLIPSHIFGYKRKIQIVGLKLNKNIWDINYFN